MEALTILHLSDLQFGRNHRFAGIDVGEERWDSLASRLALDLRSLRRRDVAPDLVAVTGDISEWGRKSEFVAAHGFLESLVTELGLPRSRVLLIPGNHDINRARCEAYFRSCDADEHAPEPPFVEKWLDFQAFFNRFYGDDAPYEFSLEQPWTIFELPELRTVVAGLNSTMRESHRDEDHYGWVGEAQMRFFVDLMASAKERGLLRLGLVHHNLKRGEVRDDENLRDAAELRRILRPHLNMVLHGHTHVGSDGWWGPRTPVFATGSAAVKDHARPGDVPNQYQVLRIEPSRLVRLTRMYAHDERRWIADCRMSEDGNSWETEHIVVLEGVEGTFRREDLSGIDQGGGQRPGGLASQRGHSVEVVVRKDRYGDPPPRVGSWVGREAELQVLADGDLGVVFVSGIAGQGKSCLAAKFLEQVDTHSRAHQFTCWRDCREVRQLRDALLRTISELSDGRVLPEGFDGETFGVVVESFLDLADQQAAVFVFDNVDAYVDVETGEPSDELRVLLTRAADRSRSSRFIFTGRAGADVAHSAYFHLALPELTVEDALAYAGERGVDTQNVRFDEVVRRIHRITRGHALSISLLASQLKMAERRVLRLLDALESLRGPFTIEGLLDPIWKRLPDQQTRVLRSLAEMERGHTLGQIVRMTPGNMKRTKVERALQTLVKMSLVQPVHASAGPDLYDLHPIVRVFIRSNGTLDERREFQDPVIAFYERELKRYEDQEFTVREVELRLEHTRVLLNAQDHEMALEAVVELSYAVEGTGFLEQFARVGETVLSDVDWDAMTEADDELFVHAAGCVAIALCHLGRTSGSSEILDNLELQVGHVRNRRVEISSARAYMHWFAGDYNEAISAGERGLALGDEDMDEVVECRHNLALAYRDAGRVDEALELFLKGSRVDQLLAAWDEPETNARQLGNVGRCLFFKGDVETALSMYSGSLTRLLRDDDILNVGFACQWIGEAMARVGDTQAAVAFFRKAELAWSQAAPPKAQRARGALELLRAQHGESAETPTNAEVERLCRGWLERCR